MKTEKPAGDDSARKKRTLHLGSAILLRVFNDPSCAGHFSDALEPIMRRFHPNYNDARFNTLWEMIFSLSPRVSDPDAFLDAIQAVVDESLNANPPGGLSNRAFKRLHVEWEARHPGHGHAIADLLAPFYNPVFRLTLKPADPDLATLANAASWWEDSQGIRTFTPNELLAFQEEYVLPVNVAIRKAIGTQHWTPIRLSLKLFGECGLEEQVKPRRRSSLKKQLQVSEANDFVRLVKRELVNQLRAALSDLCYGRNHNSIPFFDLWTVKGNFPLGYDAAGKMLFLVADPTTSTG